MFGSRTWWSSGRYFSTFRFPKDMHIFRDPGRWKWQNCRKVEGTPTVGSISKKWGLYRGDFLVPIHQLPVPGGKLWIGTTETFFAYQSIILELVVSLQPWCDPLFETRGATHCVLQHMLVRPIVFYNTSKSIKTQLIKWKQWPGIQSWISKLCFLISRNYQMEAA